MKETKIEFVENMSHIISLSFRLLNPTRLSQKLLSVGYFTLLKVYKSTGTGYNNSPYF